MTTQSPPSSRSSKPVVALFTSIEGHYSIAMAIKQALDPKYQVVVYQERTGFYNLYLPAYHLFPNAVKLPYQLAKNTTALKLVHEVFKQMYTSKVKAFFKEHQPQAIISTYFMYNNALEELAAAENIPFINILTDPWTVHPVVVSPQAVSNLVFDQKSLDYVKPFFPDAPYTESGWFVRNEYEEKVSKKALRQKLKLDPELLTFLITGGSEGTTQVLKILPALMDIDAPLQVIVACGNNKILYNSIKQMKEVQQKLNDKLTVIPLKFTDKLHEYVQAADLVVGKAGPNSLFEAVAARVPFFAITHISGQEDGNLDIIREYDVGYVEENTSKAEALLRDIVVHPDQLQSFQPKLERLALHNAGSKKHLLKLLASSLQR